MHDLIIVGGGPAALAAATYALGKHVAVRIIAEEVGGKVGQPRGVQSQPQVAVQVGEETVQLFVRVVSSHADCILRDRVVDISSVDGHFQITTLQHGLQLSKTVIVATGVTPVTLDVAGARQWLGYGLGYSPTTVASLLGGKTVAVIGSTSRALRGAAEVARVAAQLYLILPDADVVSTPLLDRLRQRPNVTVLAGYRVTALLGTDHVEQIAIMQEDEESFIPADAVFADLGLWPHSEMVRRSTAVDPQGFIIVDADHATAVPGLFAAGDVSTAFSEQIVIALGDGTRAAVRAFDYLLAQPDAAFQPA